MIINPGCEIPESASLEGLDLLAHVNRANPHWSEIRAGSSILFSFTGPHSYVSPTVYGLSTAAPTWDFIAVHVRGVIMERFESAEDTLRVVTSTVRTFERDFGTNWDMTESIPYFKKILPGVGAFRVQAVSVEGMFKLSQEQPEHIREQVRGYFADRGRGCGGELARMMADLGGVPGCPHAGQLVDQRRGM